jgi:hypothetical protein
MGSYAGKVKDNVSSSSNDDYDGVLCRSHGDGIPVVVTSRVCEKPTSSFLYQSSCPSA